MSTVLFIIFLLAIVHFAYENIVAPTLRVYQRNKLFALRDQLRTIDFYSLSKTDKVAFECVEKSLTNCIQNLPYMNIYNFTRYKQEYEKNEKLREVVDCKINSISQCSVDELREIFNQSGKISYDAILINSGLLFLYLIPLALIAVLGEFGIKLVRDMIVTPPTLVSLEYSDSPTC